MDQGRNHRDHRNAGSDEGEHRNATRELETPINLKERFPRYKIGYTDQPLVRDGKNWVIDPNYSGTQDPWYFVIQCRKGHIAPSSGVRLWASTNSRGSQAARDLLALAETDNNVVLKQDADDGVSVTFPVSMFGTIAKIMKPIGV